MSNLLNNVLTAFVQYVRLSMYNKLNTQREGVNGLQYKVKEYREQMGITQEDLAKKAGISRTIISGLESGSITVTTTATLIKIADALGKTVSDIFLQ